MPSIVAGAIALQGPPVAAANRVLTKDALRFIADLEDRFGARRRELLAARLDVQERLDAGELPGFLPASEALRRADWKVQAAPAALQDRRIEITGPVERRLMINALNSGADVFMADFEDSLSPTWSAVVQGQANLIDAVAGTLSFEAPSGRRYALNAKTATLMVRPRGWHLDESHARIAGRPVSASLFDAGLFLFHCGAASQAKNGGPYLYLPKMESHLEARLWNDVLEFSEQRLGLPANSIKVTVLVETVFAAFQMDEILHELSQRICGLNAGRWDYLFSMIKAFRGRADMALPDRSQLTMEVPFMAAYARLLVATCHRRGTHAMGGMSAYVPNRSDPARNDIALAQVHADKVREARLGFDGTWVAHPDLVAPARQAFLDVTGDGVNQLGRVPDGPQVGARDLLDLHVDGGHVTQQGVRENLAVALRYIAAWLSGSGAIVVANLMEDTATAEIARAQVWQWIRGHTPLATGNAVTAEMVRLLLDDELESLRMEGADRATADGRYGEARDLLLELVVDRDFAPFLTASAAPLLDVVTAAAPRQP